MIFIRAVAFGITLAIAIGPIALLIIRYAATDGLQAGLASACGAALADLTYAIIALSIGTALAPLLTAYTSQIHGIAAVTLITFGLWIVWTAVRPSSRTSETAKTRRELSQRLAPLFTTYALTAANPLTIVAFIAFLSQLPLDASAATRVVAAVGLFIGSLCIQIVLALGGTLLKRAFSTRHTIQVLNGVSGVGILLFGVLGLFDQIIHQ